MYINYGCGLDAPKEWLNFDASPGVRIQKNMILRILFGQFLNVKFPANVKFGDIVKGLPGIKDNSCQGLYCSHVLEHLSLNDFRVALKRSYAMLKPGGIFRCIVPDLQYYVENYQQEIKDKDPEASLNFIRSTDLGQLNRPRSIKQLINSYLTNARHLWMWDKDSLIMELQKAGFQYIRPCQFNDSEDPMFKLVENKGRFRNAVALEAIK